MQSFVNPINETPAFIREVISTQSKRIETFLIKNSAP
jgi:hypothetical protein